MPVHVMSEQIAAAPDQVFAGLIDVERWPERIPSITKVAKESPEPLAVGAKFVETRVMYGKENSEIWEVVELTPPTRLVTRCESMGVLWLATHTVEPSGSGTSLTLQLELTYQSLIAKLFGALMGGSVTKACRADLAAIRDSFAAGPVEPPVEEPGTPAD